MVLLTVGCGDSGSSAFVPISYNPYGTVNPYGTSTCTDPTGASCVPCSQVTGLGTTNTSGTTYCNAVPGQGVGDNINVTGFPSGSTSVLSAGGGALAQMFFQSGAVGANNIRLNIDLARQNNSVIVSFYNESGTLTQAQFGYVNPAGGESQEYNGWVTDSDGVSRWKGFFQDTYGSLVLVMDNNGGLANGAQGDGLPGSGGLEGSVYFMNFQAAAGSQQGPLATCWEITWGPFDCRTWIVGSGGNNAWDAPGTVVTNSAIYPNNYGPTLSQGYIKLGTFSGMDSAAGLGTP